MEKIDFQEEIKTTDGWLCKATASKILRKSTKKAAWEVGQGLEDSAGSWKDYKGDDSKTQIQAQRCNMWRVEGKLEGQQHFWWAGTSDAWKEKFHMQDFKASIFFLLY